MMQFEWMKAALRFPRLMAAWAVVLAQPLQAQQPFTFTLIQPQITALDYGEMAYADIDGDGDYDIVAAGNSSNRAPFRPRAFVALSGDDRTLANGTLVRSFQETELPTGLWHSDVTWIDYDLDGALDFLMTGTSRSGVAYENAPLEGAIRLYRNTGGGSFTAVDAGMEGVYSGVLAAGDYDNDGDEDIFLSGLSDADNFVTRLYRNDGGRFNAAEGPFRPMAFGDAQWVDFDTDGDLDIAHAGVDAAGSLYTTLYRNDGGGRFIDLNANLPGYAFSALDWGDFDDDGDVDLALTGAKVSLLNFLDPVTEIYRNNGSGRLTRMDADLRGILYGSIGWGDYDNDGDLDLLVVGSLNVANGRSGLVYRNESGTFVARMAIPGVAASAVVWGDYDGDNDLDIFATGNNVNFNPLSRLYRNEARRVNTPPASPSGLQARVQGGGASLSWAAGEDDQTPSAGLAYNIRVGTSPGADNVVPSFAASKSGRRNRPGLGNVGPAKSWVLRDLNRGTYYWSVQAIDHSFVGSPFAEEGEFSITGGAEFPTGVDTEGPVEFALEAGYPNPFQQATTLTYALRETGPVSITVYNLLGARVRLLVERVETAGYHQAVWSGKDENGRPMGAGVYFVRMQAGGVTRAQRLVLLR